MKDLFRRDGFFYAVLAIALGVFYCVIIKSMQPFINKAESVYVTADALFLIKNIKLFPWPHFNFPTDYFAYPYKISPVFLTWTFEHDYLAGLLYKFVGIGPWEQIYMLFSLFLTATVTYHILKFFGHYETLRSGVVAMLITFCNYAAICKYPGHLTLTIVHWAVISIILDFLTIKIFFEENKFSASFILSRIAVLFLCLGLELGYIAGMAFSSLTVTAIFLLICLIIQKRSFRKIFDWCKETICYAIRDFRFNLLNSVLLVVIVAAFLFYLPLVMQIFLISRHSMVEQYMVQTASLKRIFWPIFPFFNPAMFNVHCRIDPVNGMCDTIYANCIGWSFLLILGGGIFFSGKKKWLYFLPFIVLFLLCLFVKYFPLLLKMPWFSYARFSERFSPIFIPIACLALLIIEKDFFKKWTGKLFLCILLPLFYIECFTAYRSTFLWADDAVIIKHDANFYKEVKKLRTFPGEALFFFPFAVAGGDGNGLQRCNYIPTAHAMQFASFVHKKANVFYGGRLDPSADEMPLLLKQNWVFPFQQAKNGKLSVDNFKALYQHITSHNFSAIVLFRDWLHIDFRRQIYNTFGKAVPLRYAGRNLEIIYLGAAFRNCGPKRRPEFRRVIDTGRKITVPSPYISLSNLERDAWIAKSPFNLSFILPDKNKIYHIQIWSRALLLPRYMDRQTLKIYCKSKLLKVHSYKSGKEFERIEFLLPPELIEKNGNVNLTFEYKVPPQSLADCGISSDKRKPGIMIKAIRIEERMVK